MALLVPSVVVTQGEPWPLWVAAPGGDYRRRTRRSYLIGLKLVAARKTK